MAETRMAWLSGRAVLLAFLFAIFSTMLAQAQDLAHVLHACARQISEAMPRLRGFKDISHYTVEINRLENDGDRITREAIASLFDNGIDPMVVIRWKDIFERLEEAIDATERVANILEGIVIKNS